jgi:hypothetical protein
MRHLTALILAALASAAVSEPPQASPHTECLRAGRGAVRGVLTGMSDGNITLAEDGASAVYRQDEFRRFVFPPPVRTEEAPVLKVAIADGTSIFPGQILTDEEEGTLRLEGRGWRIEGVPLAWIRGIATPRLLDGPAERRAEFAELVAQPPLATDRLVLARDGRRHTLACVVRAFTEEGVDVELSGTSRLFPWGSIESMLLASLTEVQMQPGHLLRTADGSQFRLGEVGFSDGVLRGTRGPAVFEAPLHGLVWLQVESTNYAYLSDMGPAEVATRPFLDIVWPHRMDQCVNRQPLRLNGVEYPKGIGMHSYTALTFDLGGQYREFHSLIGVDDAAGGRGSVAFEVLGDGRSLYRSNAMTGADAPAGVEIDVTAVSSLTLVADFTGKLQPAGNFADWAEARVVQ